MTVHLVRMRPEGDNDFNDIIHPETNADMVIQTTKRLFVSLSEKVRWNNKADKDHTHTSYYTKSDLATAGKSEVSWSNIIHKPMTLKPAPHTHIITDITNLATILDGKASKNHTHNYSPIGHKHIVGNITGLEDRLTKKSNVGHAHTISDIINLSSSLNGKANVSHTHNYAPSSHTHTFDSLSSIPTNRTRKIIYQTGKPSNTNHPNGTICIVYK